MGLIRFILACARQALVGSRLYHGSLALAALVLAIGVQAYVHQLTEGLIVTGMNDHVTWGVYIGNFTYLVGVAAAAVMLMIPTYVFHDAHAKKVVLIAEGLAVAACAMALAFVTVDLGRPERFLYLVPLIGSLQLPQSMLAWDVVVIPGYLALNVGIPFYVLYRRYHGKELSMRALMPWVVLTMFWAIALHVVTAFLFSADIARPFWHSALLGPRFLASAFCSGPALLIMALYGMRWLAGLDVPDTVIRMLAVIVTVALQVNLVMLAAEVFNELYARTEHSSSAVYAFFGLGEANALVPWTWAAIVMEILAVVLLMVGPLRRRTSTLLLACGLVAVGVWIEKGMGLIIPGFVPSPLGEVVEYAPTWVEIRVSFGIWALGYLIFVILARVATAIERGELALAPSVHK